LFFNKLGKDVVHVVGLEKGDHIISLMAYLKFHMHVFDGTGIIKKENKVWGQKTKQPYATPKKKIVLSLAFD
jgi:hypothetical protein